MEVISKLCAAGLYLVKIPPLKGKPTKAPVVKGWNLPESPDNPNGYSNNPHSFLNCTGYNFGLIHEPSHTFCLDLDDLSAAVALFEEVGLPLKDWFADPVRIEIKSPKANRGKLLYRLPELVTPVYHKFGALFELRCGSGKQDVIIGRHPEGGSYQIIGDIDHIPMIPDALLDVVLHWEAWEQCFKPPVISENPKDYPAFIPTQPDLAGAIDAKAEFLQRHTLDAILTRNGYVKKGNRYLRPGSSTGVPGVRIYYDAPGGEARAHSDGADALNDGHQHDAFECYRLLECGGDYKTAINWNPEITAHNRALFKQFRQSDRQPVQPVHEPGFDEPPAWLSEGPPQKQAHFEAQEWTPDLSATIDYLIPVPGLAQDIQRWILDTSIKQQPALAFVATLSVLSVAFGRNIQVQGIKGNIISLCLAESGEGKDWPLKACKKLLDCIGAGASVYGQMASGAALVDALVDTPSALLPIDEAGHYFSGISGKNANQFSKEIMPLIMEVYTSAADSYREKKRKGQEARIITEPNLSIIGMTTERQIMDTLRTSEVTDGSLARFLVVFGSVNRPINRKRLPDSRVPDSIKKQLERCARPFNLYSEAVEITPEYEQAKIALEDRLNNKAIEMGNAGGDKAQFKPVYSRVAVRALQMALLIDQCQSLEVLAWCAHIAEKSCDIFAKKFLHLSADNDNERMVKIIERAIKEAGRNGLTPHQLWNKTRSIPPAVKRAILQDMVEAEKVFIYQKRLGDSQKPSNLYFWKK